MGFMGFAYVGDHNFTYWGEKKTSENRLEGPFIGVVTPFISRWAPSCTMAKETPNTRVYLCIEISYHKRQQVVSELMFFGGEKCCNFK